MSVVASVSPTLVAELDLQGAKLVGTPTNAWKGAGPLRDPPDLLELGDFLRLPDYPEERRSGDLPVQVLPVWVTRLVNSCLKEKPDFHALGTVTATRGLTL